MGRAKREDHYASRFTSHVSRNDPLVLIVLGLFHDEVGHDGSEEEIYDPPILRLPVFVFDFDDPTHGC